MPDPIFFSGGSTGNWRVRRQDALCGEGLPAVARLDKRPAPRPGAAWVIGGMTSNLRYTHAVEKRVLDATPSVLGRPAATCAALIPITKSAAWWAMAQDERRAVIEDKSRHIAIGSDYLSVISRQLVHCRDQAGAVFDFLTWFEFAPADEGRFDELLGKLRASSEWAFVEREAELRLEKDG
jgi:hypothetical protein